MEMKEPNCLLTSSRLPHRGALEIGSNRHSLGGAWVVDTEELDAGVWSDSAELSM